jgi:hypothetical protein
MCVVFNLLNDWKINMTTFQKILSLLVTSLALGLVATPSMAAGGNSASSSSSAAAPSKPSTKHSVDSASNPSGRATPPRVVYYGSTTGTAF